MPETIALVGGETLLGREVREVLGETALAQNLRLVAGAEEEAGTLADVGGSVAFLAKLEPDAIEDAAVVILAGGADAVKKALAANPQGLVIDLTYATEEDPDARIRAPQVEAPEYRAEHAGPQVVAHPAAIAIAMALRRLNADYPITRAVIHVFGPSEFGTPGIEELQQQTVNLLSFQQMPKKIFDTQLAYAMLAQLGSEAPVSLAALEDRIERHLATLLERLEGGFPMPSLRLIQAPVFHGYTFSFWIEFEDAPTASDIEDAMNQESFDVRTGDLEPPNNVGMAGQSGIAVGAISPDRNNANALWIWAAVDNLRLAAESAAIIAGEAI